MLATKQDQNLTILKIHSNANHLIIWVLTVFYKLGSWNYMSMDTCVQKLY